MNNTPRRLLIAGGGTGGHLFPALAVAERWRERYGLHSVHFIGGQRGLENRLVPNAGFTLETLAVGQLKGKGLPHKLRTLGGLLPAVWQARGMVQRFDPHVVLGVGGYASAPAMVAARSLGIPMALHEQNARAGLTNRLLSHLAQQVLVSFNGVCAQFPGRACQLTGNPVRQALAAVPPLQIPTLFTPQRPLRILVFGGSQGASIFTQRVPEALLPLAQHGAPIQVTQQVQEADADALQRRYQEGGIEAITTPFIEDMATAYAQADLVICRSGATSVAELAATGRPSIMVPYPYAADDHQAANAQALVSIQGGWMRRQEQFHSAWLEAFITSLCMQPAQLQRAGEIARSYARPNADMQIVTLLASMVKMKR
ncbi:UDP-N-acetylglucosamine--N-acetylmuramyl-(pentapeptide) pyrophosphoryl-undecaprenol N-acetylglucosamine transferase [Magnetococcus marinus MC-1]|uniref:UDP-N-acetylglucosamine--N-acetylmuramyl-(pentapeptide) pyrophosphoryl-undecaprenol N-acetylglucosamine transferase n=1 Tax=Magnetococcus marinus (strain ATCC BAA-1437 / JCM 17883 / MC-1) TaxID=156889 RepID=MURG_MAGMM|nr:undecaprenyldiphospho-muramoylpentapeptide beta-N-acetylglucosaminyltransferase [Magnetococcus marinus]A0L5N1.1 RecName: Full=UDP-N-acetylglucosamine--N-acetylmuramyl-(pentapeptide) pyrophosphoryl-undecaprenol N-acetylglucosamine transferase; AltName: Full=Undecaprenyl-PP-MurNAc-pentapeptide-UDPGlcNAc GlcNAc transferase [Magnetococcus marinus MC-1]ABK43274.1 UDP-N-acetylglucosamine--N-acetylmuramyl-(pentapeptide) pyrophosphoryl-undecaprenol N-acetylglucosamine transferase [Magnetococcus marinu